MLIARDWDILRVNGHLRWTRLKTFYKININCFFRKKSPSGLNLTSNFGPNSDKMVKIQNSHKSCSNRAYFVQKNLLIIFLKSAMKIPIRPERSIKIETDPAKQNTERLIYNTMATFLIFFLTTNHNSRDFHVNFNLPLKEQYFYKRLVQWDTWPKF